MTRGNWGMGRTEENEVEKAREAEAAAKRADDVWERFMEDEDAILTAMRTVDREAQDTYALIGESEDDPSLCRLAAETRLGALRGRWTDLYWRLHALRRDLEKVKGGHDWELSDEVPKRPAAFFHETDAIGDFDASLAALVRQLMAEPA